jgi:hypothetical protein
LRDLPGVGPLEWAISQKGWTDENEEWALDLSEDLFGIVPDDTIPWTDDSGKLIIGGVEFAGSTHDELFSQCEAWEKHFEVLKYFRDESDAFWSSMGWDVTDGQGKQLEVMRILDRPLVCVVKKLHVDAKLNIDQEQNAEAWGAKLAEDAKRFKPKR